MTGRPKWTLKSGSFTPLFSSLNRYRGAAGQPLTLTERVAFGFIWRMSQLDQGVCRASWETFEIETGAGRSTIKLVISGLIREGLVEDVTPQGLRKVGKDGRDVITGARHLRIAQKGQELVWPDVEEGPTVDPRGANDCPPRGSTIDPEETSTRDQKRKKTPNPVSSPSQHNQGRKSKAGQFRGAGRNAKAMQMAMMLEDDKPGESSRPRTPQSASPPPRPFVGSDTVKIDPLGRNQRTRQIEAPNRGLGTVDEEGNIKI